MNSRARKLIWICLGATIGAIASWWFLFQPARQSLRFESARAVAPGNAFSYEPFAGALRAYVDDRGLVNYRELKANRQDIDSFAASIASLEPSVYDQWSEKDKIAFLINAYNALTLEAIISNYPIKASLTRSVIYPRNSIRQIPGVWDKLDFLVMGRRTTLDHIEHEILRKDFNEPRIHVALVCAAMGCPPLRSEPYNGENLESQLDDQTRTFLANPQKFRIDREKGVVYLSPIFKWYGADFEKRFAADARWSVGHSRAERAVLSYVGGYLSVEDRDYLATGKYSIQYLDYDWSLNEQRYE